MILKKKNSAVRSKLATNGVLELLEDGILVSVWPSVGHGGVLWQGGEHFEPGLERRRPIGGLGLARAPGPWVGVSSAESGGELFSE